MESQLPRLDSELEFNNDFQAISRPEPSHGMSPQKGFVIKGSNRNTRYHSSSNDIDSYNTTAKGTYQQKKPTGPLEPLNSNGNKYNSVGSSPAMRDMGKEILAMKYPMSSINSSSLSGLPKKGKTLQYIGLSPNYLGHLKPLAPIGESTQGDDGQGNSNMKLSFKATVTYGGGKRGPEDVMQTIDHNSTSRNSQLLKGKTRLQPIGSTLQ